MRRNLFLLYSYLVASGLAFNGCSAKVETNPSPSGGKCTYNGKAYSVGTTFNVDCNTCSCAGNAELTCTERDCSSAGSGGAGAGGATVGYAVGGSYGNAGGSPAGGGLPAGGSSSQGGSPVTGGLAPTGGKVSTGGRSTGGSATGGYTATVQSTPSACPGVPYVTGSAAGAGTCSELSVVLEPTPVDLYLMVDRTASMTYPISSGSAVTRWDILQSGLQSFLSPSNTVVAGARLALQFFGATGNPDDPKECDPTSYATPVIEFESLSTGAAKINGAIQAEASVLGGQTPWMPAIHGALLHAQKWQSANPQRAVAVALITDGYPTECDTDVSAIAQMVSEFYLGVQGTYNTVGKPAIRTYMVGIGVDKFNLNTVAQAGGTRQSLIVAAADEVAGALKNIVSAYQITPPCQTALPSPPGGGVFNPDKFKLTYTPFGASTEQILAVDSAAACGAAVGGFYFDNPNAPTRLTLCPCTCANVGVGELGYLFFGC